MLPSYFLLFYVMANSQKHFFSPPGSEINAEIEAQLTNTNGVDSVTTSKLELEFSFFLLTMKQGLGIPIRNVILCF